MICTVCLSTQRAARSEREPAVPRPEPGASPPTCERCGRVLDGDTGARMAAKESQLARFGLTGRPLLSRRRT